MNFKIEQWLVSALHRLEADGQPIPHNSWQRLLSNMLRKWFPAPHQSPWMEWEYGTWVGSFAGYDEIGRQLGEANVQPQWLATPLPGDKWRSFKGPGIRQGHPFNNEAMRETSQCWDELLRDAAALRDKHCHLHRRTGQPLSASDLYMITHVAVSIPAFLLRRGDKPTANGAVPRLAAAAFKVIGGMYAATNCMMSQAHPALTKPTLDIDDFLQYLEDESLLLSPESRACAAPVKMIRQIVSTAVAPADEMQITEGLTHLGNDVDRAFAYGTLCSCIDLGVQLHWRSLRHYLRPLLPQPDLPAEVLEMLQVEEDLGIEDETPLSAYATVARHLLAILDDTDIEQALLDALPLNETEAETADIEQISAGCARVEKAMCIFARCQQAKLDSILQRKPLTVAEDGWSPAPGSQFLQRLLKLEPRLAVAFQQY